MGVTNPWTFSIMDFFLRETHNTVRNIHISPVYYMPQGEMGFVRLKGYSTFAQSGADEATENDVCAFWYLSSKDR